MHEHGWSFGAIMFNLTILNLASMVATPLVGKLTDRIGPRRVLLPSIVIMAVCLLLWGYTASTLTQLYIISGIYGFLTTGAQSITYTKLLTSWFFDNRGVALGVAAAGLGGRLLVGWLFDRFFAPRVACVIFLLAALGYALAGTVITTHLNWTVFAIAAILMGLGFGAESDLIGYLSSRYFGFRYFGTIYGTRCSRSSSSASASARCSTAWCATPPAATARCCSRARRWAPSPAC